MREKRKAETIEKKEYALRGETGRGVSNTVGLAAGGC